MSLKQHLPEKKKKLTREQKLELLRQASEVMDLDLIDRWQAKPMNERTNFLRVRVPGAPNKGAAL
jgi:uncharacterized damage-inducible protein DinB